MKLQDLIQICVCPVSGQKLRQASEAELSQVRSLLTRASSNTENDQHIERSNTSLWNVGLVSEDGSRFYPTKNSIALLLASEAIILK